MKQYTNRRHILSHNHEMLRFVTMAKNSLEFIVPYVYLWFGPTWLYGAFLHTKKYAAAKANKLSNKKNCFRAHPVHCCGPPIQKTFSIKNHFFLEIHFLCPLMTKHLKKVRKNYRRRCDERKNKAKNYTPTLVTHRRNGDNSHEYSART